MRPPARAPLAVTMGEPAGVGGEIMLKAWLARGSNLPSFLVIDDPDRLSALAARLRLDVPVVAVETPDEAARRFASALPVLPEPLAATARPGRPDPANAGAIVRSIERAVALARTGRAAAVVTNPIHKAALREAGFPHPGHTEFLAELAGIGTRTAMMLACPGLRVVPVTRHLALRDAVAALTSEIIVEHGRITAEALATDFEVARPRIAVAALNPHAGESGVLGREETDIIAPAVAELRGWGIDAVGPIPADTLFYERARARYDAVLCMHHDQALIPLKTIDFDHGVNITLGLPFVRTSPDHGTALDVAGTGRASPTSLIAALRTADEIAGRRHQARAAHKVA